jgi:hypothetical protein
MEGRRVKTETYSTGWRADEHVLVTFVCDVEDDGLKPVERFVRLRIK